MKKLFLILLLLVLLPTFACALGPKIVKHNAMWDANTEPDLAGYYLYWRTPIGTFSDTDRIPVGLGANPLLDLLTLNLPLGQYVIAVSAYDAEGNESGLSIEVPWDATYPGNPKNLKVTP